ncbi:MAG: hypothetical protein M5U28_30915 [Sandaracinaceae bacterium]|nr:hypothetical protein [Sandaracinaceae bacterium]
MSTRIEQADEAFSLGTYGSVVLMVWRGPATRERLRAASALVRRSIDLHGSTAVISVIERGAPTPAPEDRHELARDMRALAPSIVGAGFVLEGGGEHTSRVMKVAMMIDGLRAAPLTRKYCVDPAEAATWIAARCRGAMEPAPSRDELLAGIAEVRAAVLEARVEASELSLEVVHAEPALTVGAFGRIVILTWRALPAVERLREVVRLVHAQAAAGGRVAVISCFERARVPDARRRRELARELATIAPELSAVALVFEGGRRWSALALAAENRVEALRGRRPRRWYCVARSEAATWLAEHCRDLSGMPSSDALADAIDRLRAASA